ncbi:HPr family phosphocarrier protein [Paenibacillus sp. LHD-117]|uniref:HPr family phosphocarrier protein n=1 Tax=Paenibacillus sp. LHD-117 TaxID=3071412 RepID=UPI0027E0B54F|nr:HPr family phosphocarrier protein [Paenibacillus sp. LHD-117]MDQ6418874.1 HPr family phosphocarrier protein [Paenibacillus sp. LHD-117]
MKSSIRSIVDINQTAGAFQSSIVLRTGDRFIDAKSILGLSMTLYRDQTYRLDIHGPDEEEAKAAMLDVFLKYGLLVEIND